MRHRFLRATFTTMFILVGMTIFRPTTEPVGSVDYWQSSILQFAEEVYVVAVQGDYAYLGVGDRMVIVDVSSPTAPRFMSETEPLAVGWCDFRYSENVHDVVVSGNYAYVAAGSGGLYIVDVSDPWHPMIARRYDLSVAVAVAMEGSTLAVGTNYCNDLGGDFHLFRMDNATDFVRIGNPIQHGGFYHVPGENKMTMEDNYVYAATANDGSIHVISTLDPYAYVVFGFDETRPFGVAAQDPYLFVHLRTRSDLTDQGKILDVTNPFQPSDAGYFRCPANVTIDGHRLYGTEDPGGGQILTSCVHDISDLRNPKQIASHYIVARYATDQAAQGNCAYVTTHDPEALHILCSTNTEFTPAPTPAPRLVYLPLAMHGH